MNSFTSVAAALAMVMAVSAQSDGDLPHNDFYTLTQKCITGQTFIDRCNYCNCNAAGIGYCDRMFCPTPEKPHIDGFQLGGLTCPPGKKFYDGCKACTCGNSGRTAVCNPTADCNIHARSSRSTPGAGINLPHIDNFHETNECTPNKSFKHQCNTCQCSRNGKSAACTRMFCLPTEKIRIDNFTKGMKCSANKTFYDKCNTCTCGADGASADCTLMACLE